MWFVLSGLTLLLLISFGCMGAKERPAGVEPPSAGQYSNAPLASILGDTDISPQTDSEGGPVLYQTDVVGPDNETLTIAVPGNSAVSIETQGSLNASDTETMQVNDSDAIHNQYVVGPE